jgi:N-acetylglutamate synthase-like GNAT family acetyltransferase
MKTTTVSRQTNSAHLVIRAFIQDDIPDIVSILKENSLYEDLETLQDLYVLTENETIVGLVQIAPHTAYYFLSYMAIRLGLHKKGLGSYLLNNLLIGIDKPIYLDTIIPEYYERFGFKIIQRPDILPLKEDSVCKICIPEKCRTMKWTPI